MSLDLLVRGGTVVTMDAERRVQEINAQLAEKLDELAASEQRFRRAVIDAPYPAMIHTIDGDTPTLRLQQDGSSGFAPQTWDVAGNETNFFIRDVTNGSQLPFRIRPDAPTNSIFVDVDGDVVMGTSSPDSALHVRSTDETAKLHV